MDKKTQALVEQYARSLVEVAFEQDSVSTIQEEVSASERSLWTAPRSS